jgi:hypothetical protein
LQTSFFSFVRLDAGFFFHQCSLLTRHAAFQLDRVNERQQMRRFRSNIGAEMGRRCSALARMPADLTPALSVAQANPRFLSKLPEIRCILNEDAGIQTSSKGTEDGKHG